MTSVMNLLSSRGQAGEGEGQEAKVLCARQQREGEKKLSGMEKCTADLIKTDNETPAGSSEMQKTFFAPRDRDELARANTERVSMEEVHAQRQIALFLFPPQTTDEAAEEEEKV